MSKKVFKHQVYGLGVEQDKLVDIGKKAMFFASELGGFYRVVNASELSATTEDETEKYEKWLRKNYDEKQKGVLK